MLIENVPELKASSFVGSGVNPIEAINSSKRQN